MDCTLFLTPVITLLSAQFSVLALAQFRFRPKKLFIILSLEFIIQMAINMVIMFFSGYKGYARWYILTMDLPALITFWYISKRRDLRDLFTVLVTIFLSFCISIPSLWMTKQLGGNTWYYNLFRSIIYAVVIPLLYRFVRRQYIQLQEEIENGWGMFCVLPLMGAANLYYEYLQYFSNGNFYKMLWECVVTVVVMSIIYLIFIYVFKQLQEKYMVQEQKRILDMQNKAQRDQFEQQREASEKSNRRWHDLRHNMQELIEMLEAGKVDMAISYLKEQRGVDNVPKVEYCLHTAVNSILCLWAERSKKAGIEIKILTEVPENLMIEPMELSSLFANAFENAYEGCLRLSQDTKKYIKVEAHYNGKRLAIGFTNSCTTDILFDDEMPVSNRSGGGIGTRSIAYTVQRFNGTKYFEAKDGVFTARFVLNI